MAGSFSNHHSEQLVANLNETSRFLLSRAFSASTTATYRRAVQLFITFRQETSKPLPVYPISIPNIIQFISYLYVKSLAASTISTYIAALASINKIYKGPAIFESLLVKKLLIGVHKTRNSVDMRLPIQLDLLCLLVDSTFHISASKHMQLLLRAMYLLAFHAFLRIGEIAAKNATDSFSPLQFSDVVFLPNTNPTSCFVNLQKTKNSNCNQSIHLRAVANTQPLYCPVRALTDFKQFRGCHEGMFFTLPCKGPITKQCFNTHLARSIAYAGLDPKRYKAHSFRIGAATYAALRGTPNHTIQLLGRWKSDAFLKYIRIPNLSNMHK